MWTRPSLVAQTLRAVARALPLPGRGGQVAGDVSARMAVRPWLIRIRVEQASAITVRDKLAKPHCQATFYGVMSLVRRAVPSPPVSDADWYPSL